jgi:hypothetical protein
MRTRGPTTISDCLLTQILQDIENEDIAALATQAGSHMESMRSNLEQIAAIGPAMTRSKAAVQEVLLKHLDAEQYGNILLGEV